MRITGRKRGREEPELPLIGDMYVANRLSLDRGFVFTNHRDVEPTSDSSPRVHHGVWFKNKATQIKYYSDPDFWLNRAFKSHGNYTYEIQPASFVQNFSDGLTRASYVPFIIKKEGPSEKGERYWLLGSFVDYPEVKADFGGKCVKNETVESCATRELMEETEGVLVEPVLKVLYQGRALAYLGTDTSRGVTGAAGITGSSSGSPDTKKIVFVMVNMTDHLEELDEIQEKINLRERNFGEKYGPLGFYREADLKIGIDSKTGKRIYTSFALTDFIRNLNIETPE